MKKVLLLLTLTILNLSCSNDDSNPVNQTPIQEGNIVRVITDYLDQRMLNIGFGESQDGGMVIYGDGVHPIIDVHHQDLDLDELQERGSTVRNGNYLIIRHKDQGSLPSFCRITIIGDNVGGTHVFEYENKEIGDIRIALPLSGLDDN